MSRVTHFDANLAVSVVDRELEAGLRVLDAIRGELACHQLCGIQDLSRLTAQNITHE
ncbi:MAG TPA: hypothetical protein VNZ01_10650 [Solirubrobacteraceae bacterium]|jgi:hypothetical protein|nr:hypothetical protein [Solirubrobacteraceae bacterium]